TFGMVELDAAMVRGGTVNITAKADSASIFGDEDAPTGLPGKIRNVLTKVVGVVFQNSDVLGLAVSNAVAEIDVNAGTSIVGSSVSLNSEADTKAATKAFNSSLAVAVGVSTPSATVTVASGASITSAGLVSIRSVADSDLTVSAKQNFLGPNTKNK